MNNMHLVDKKLYKLKQLNNLLEEKISYFKLVESKSHRFDQMCAVIEAISEIILVISVSENKIKNIELLTNEQSALEQSSLDNDNCNTNRLTIDLFFRKDTSEICLQQVCRALKTGLTHSFDYSLSCNGRSFEYCATIIPVCDDSVLWVARDISKYIRSQEVEKREEKFEVLINSVPVGIFETDVNGDCTYVNPRWLEIAGMREAEALGKGWINALHPEDREQVVKQWYNCAISGCEFAMECRFITPQGKVTWLKTSAVAMRDINNNITGYLGTITDINAPKLVETALKISEAQERQKVQELEQILEKLRELANLDALTQVANRYCFDNYLNEQWYIKNHKNPIALILLDIDYFKLYNDTYGHPSGDACLVQVANALLAATKHNNGLVARYGGEEFAIILPDKTSVQVQRVAQRIRKYIQKLNIPHSKSSVSVNVTVSIGIAHALPYINTAPQILIDKADGALYKAKTAGRNCYYTVFE
ncbi:response regulator receiver modulated diguanylate cyclase [Calothrix sp. NIES-4071]|nr:response regulator receiver modulated diguanylate cyclase [Calothrix sp. NIES-4071]BAZ54698.1 response regulator receiver modulated diguanylate cyclase [Calothrix sp. NIES-4105]